VSDPLDRPVWHALTGRQAHLAVASGAAVRIDPGYGPFAALRDESDEAWSALASSLTSPKDAVGLVETDRVSAPSTFRTTREGELVQMVWQGDIVDPIDDERVILLGELDAAEMSELALDRTRAVGEQDASLRPFLRRTH